MHIAPVAQPQPHTMADKPELRLPYHPALLPGGFPVRVMDWSILKNWQAYVDYENNLSMAST